jgi:hypothetical protein
MSSEQLERVCDLLFNHPERDESDEAAIDLIQQLINADEQARMKTTTGDFGE